jgi:hypothetical protein
MNTNQPLKTWQWLVIVAGVAISLLAGCTSSITGGSARKLDDHAVITTGATTADNRTTVVTVTPAGGVEVRSGTAVATTQPTRTETTHTETATTQPSASSTTGLPKLTTTPDGATAVAFDLDTVAGQAKIRASSSSPSSSPPSSSWSSASGSPPPAASPAPSSPPSSPCGSSPSS